MYSNLKPRKLFLAVTIALSMSPATFAANNAMASALEKIADGINKLYAHSVATAETKLTVAKQMLYEKTYDLPNTVVANTSQKQSTPSNALGTVLTNKLTMADANLPPTMLSLIAGSDFQPTKEMINIYGENRPRLTNPGDMAFNFDALITPSTGHPIMGISYADKDKAFDHSELANYYIKLLAGTDALGVIRTHPEINLMNIPDLLPYLVNLRQYVAQQSIGLGNINMILNQYKPVKDLGKNANLPGHTKDNPDASPAEVDDYMAKKRISNLDWYKAIETAAPTTIARETLYVLAEMRYEMYQNRQLQERILAAVSANQLQNLDAKAKELAAKKEDLIKREIAKRS